MTNVQKITVLLTRSHLRVPHGPIAWEMPPLTEANNEIRDLSLSFHAVKPTRSSAIAKTAEHMSTILKLVLVADRRPDPPVPASAILTRRSTA